MKLRRSYSRRFRALRPTTAIALSVVLGATALGGTLSSGVHAAPKATTHSGPAKQTTTRTTATESRSGVDESAGDSQVSPVSLNVPEGVMVGETLVAQIACSRPLTADDEPWMIFRPSGFNATVPVVTADHISLTATGFTVTLPIPADFKTGAFQAFAGCTSPPTNVGIDSAETATGAAEWIMIRPNKEYPSFVSVTPTEAELGTDVTFTVTCSMPPGNAGLIIDFESEVKLVEVNQPGGYTVDGSTFSVTTKVPIDAPVGAYSMIASCDGPSSTFDYFPPPTSYSDGLTFAVLTSASALDPTLPSAL